MLTMGTKSSIKYASIDAYLLNDVESKKSLRKSGGGGIDESKLAKTNRRSHSLDRLDENSGDSRAERRNRRQFMHLVRRDGLVLFKSISILFRFFRCFFFFIDFGKE